MTRFRLEYALPFVSVAFCAALVWAGEGVLKDRYPTLTDPRMTGEFGMFFRVHPRLGRWHKPGFSGTYRGHVYTINLNGLRDTATPYQAAAPRRRIVMLGDSVTWGYGVDDGQTFSDVLERALVNADVINMSVSGYGTGEELLLLQEEGLKYAPDTVVLVFCMSNDVENTYFPESDKAAFPANTFYLENGALKIRPIRLFWGQRIGIAVNERSYLANFFLKKVFPRLGLREGAGIERRNRSTRKSMDGDLASFGGLTYLQVDPSIAQGQPGKRSHVLPPTPASYYKVELTKKVLKEMADVVRRSGATFVVVLSPFQSQLNPDDPAFHNPLNAELMRFFAEQKIRAVDLLPRFLERGDDPDEIFGDNTHYSAEGHRVVAALLQELLAGVQPAGPR